MVLVMMAMVYLSIFKDVLKETVLQDSVSSYYFVRTCMYIMRILGLEGIQYT